MWYLNLVATSFLLNEVAAFTPSRYGLNTALRSPRPTRTVTSSVTPPPQKKKDEGPMVASFQSPQALKKNGEEKEGLPWWWAYFWQLPFTARGKAGEPLTLGDTMHVFRTNIEQIYGDYPSVDGTPLAEGDLSGLTDGTMYLGLYQYLQEYGPMFKLCFGPKSFIVVSEPAAAKHILRDNNSMYNKGVLAEILEDIMGKGLIPADPVTWKIRRRAIVPAFHKKWLAAMVGLFGDCTERLVDDFDQQLAKQNKPVDLEERFGSLALDIIGRAVFNYDFDSVKRTSPVVKAAIDTLREAEHRSMTPAPYWKIPGAYTFIPRQVAFKNNMALINSELNKAIEECLKDQTKVDVEELENRNYETMANPSLLRFLVDMRGEDTTNIQLRDDLITMLIAGHETTASALTWAIFELVQQPQLLAEVRAEIDRVLPNGGKPTMENIESLELVRLCIAESLRMYPEPPLLIRRASEEDTIPAVGIEKEVKLLRGSDLFIAVYNLHRSPKYWEAPNTFTPTRFLKAFKNPEEAPSWKGFDPALWKGQLYPNEIAADYAYIPFGAGPRKCVGDQFAMLEATVALAMLLQKYDFQFSPKGPTPTPEDVGTNTGATIHTRNGLWMDVTARAV